MGDVVAEEQTMKRPRRNYSAKFKATVALNRDPVVRNYSTTGAQAVAPHVFHEASFTGYGGCRHRCMERHEDLLVQLTAAFETRDSWGVQ
jgi:hypothetical protein